MADLDLFLRFQDRLALHVHLVGLCQLDGAVVAVVATDYLVFLLFLLVQALERNEIDLEMQSVAVAVDAFAVASRVPFFGLVVVAFAFCHHLDHCYRTYPFCFAAVVAGAAAFLYYYARLVGLSFLRPSSAAAIRRQSRTLWRSLTRRWLLFRSLLLCSEFVHGFLFLLQFFLFFPLEH